MAVRYLMDDVESKDRSVQLNEKSATIFQAIDKAQPPFDLDAQTLGPFYPIDLGDSFPSFVRLCDLGKIMFLGVFPPLREIFYADHSFKQVKLSIASVCLVVGFDISIRRRMMRR
ncbi:MAG TPA: hypothetical protein VF020_21140 [Chthoniobacterales bacterium]